MKQTLLKSAMTSDSVGWKRNLPRSSGGVNIASSVSNTHVFSVSSPISFRSFNRPKLLALSANKQDINMQTTRWLDMTLMTLPVSACHILLLRFKYKKKHWQEISWCTLFSRQFLAHFYDILGPYIFFTSASKYSEFQACWN